MPYLKYNDVLFEIATKVESGINYWKWQKVIKIVWVKNRVKMKNFIPSKNFNDNFINEINDSLSWVSQKTQFTESMYISAYHAIIIRDRWIYHINYKLYYHNVSPKADNFTARNMTDIWKQRDNL
jgi:hypothetical protein